MSTIRNSLFPVIIFSLLLSLALSSCSSDDTVTDRRRELLALTDADAMLVIAADPSVILRSAGAEVKNGRIVPSSELRRIASDNKNFAGMLSGLTEAEGIDFHNLVISVGAHSASAAFCVTDAGDFGSWVSDKDYTATKSGDWTVYTGDGPAIVLRSDIAIMSDWNNANSPEDIADKARELAALPAEKQLKPWIVENLCRSDISMIIDIHAVTGALSGEFAAAGTPVLPDNFYNADCRYLTGGFVFDGPSLHIEGKTCDAEGRQVAMLPDGTYSPLSDRILSLLKGYQLSFAFSVTDSWREMMKKLYQTPDILMVYPGGKPGNYTADDMYANSPVTALNAFGIAASLKDGASLFKLTPADIKGVCAVNYDEAAIKRTIDSWKSLNIPADKSLADIAASMSGAGTFSFAPLPEYPDFRLYTAGKDGFGILSTDSTDLKAASEPVKQSDGILGIITADLPSSHPLLRLASCPFGVSISGITYTDGYECDFRLTECEGGFISNLIVFFSKL